MLLIIAAQFYIGYYTQKQLVSELQRISSNINTVVDSHYANILEELKEMRVAVPPPAKLKPESLVFSSEFASLPETLYSGLISELNRLQRLELDSIALPDGFLDQKRKGWDDENLVIGEDIQKVVSEFRKKQQEIDEQIRHVQEKYPPEKIREMAGEITAAKRAENIKVEAIIIDPDRIRRTSGENFVWMDADSVLAVPSSGSGTFTIRIPDFSLPNRPKVIQYHLRPLEMERTVEAALNKNLLMTIGLFAISVLGILFVSRKFLKPIGNLKTSFDQVIQGNLDVSVPVNSRDEIGDLTQSFNHMVLELQKNREKEKLLQQKEKLASMGQLAAGVAHEVKNPLNAIHLTIDHLKDKYSPEDENALAYINTIQGEINRLDKLVDNFLNFVRSEHLRKQKTNVNGLISDVLDLLHREIESCNIRVEVQLQDPFIVELDPERFKTVLLNIVLNAVHAMPDGGNLRIISDNS
ncbi:MAG: HAMP domain-containing protein, partial [Calditrichaeota bacterium]